MRQALVNMLAMQSKMNSRVHKDWQSQQFAWYRATWIECGELIDHYGYKWWKKQQADMEQVHLEIIDIWHFGLSALFRDGKSVEDIALEIESAVANFEPMGLDVREATEALALHCLQTKDFSVEQFWELMLAAGLDFDSLYSAYIGKNVLNFFRQDNGYQDGTYIKHWLGKEDNEHLVALVADLDKDAQDFSDQIYHGLSALYQTVIVESQE